MLAVASEEGLLKGPCAEKLAGCDVPLDLHCTLAYGAECSGRSLQELRGRRVEMEAVVLCCCPARGLACWAVTLPGHLQAVVAGGRSPHVTCRVARGACPRDAADVAVLGSSEEEALGKFGKMTAHKAWGLVRGRKEEVILLRRSRPLALSGE
eukprot:Hpha_TRINITY_DN12325_c0_g1::TRINITY_DN12325_c0_g1_i2::g.155815::m.155815